MKSVRRLLALLVAGIALSGCTLVPTDSSPRVVPSGNVPSGLLGRSPSSRTTHMTLWYRNPAGSLSPYPLTVPAYISVTSQIQLLALGFGRPNDASTSVPLHLSVDRAVIHRKHADLIIRKGLATLSGPTQKVALAQIVLTLHHLTRVTDVALHEGSEAWSMTLREAQEFTTR